MIGPAIDAMQEGSLLGGRVRHAQPVAGHRTGLEPVLLAATIPARAGQRVLEGGTGSGAALLCLAARVPGITGVGLERDKTMAEVARANFAANGFADLQIVQADLTTLRQPDTFDHAFANPPWHGAAGTESPDSLREAARRGTPALLGHWAAGLAQSLRWHGTLTLIFATAVLPDALAACAGAGCGSPTVAPLWPKAGRAAKLTVLRTVKGGRAPCRILPGLLLHEADGRFTEIAESILRGGAALPLD